MKQGNFPNTQSISVYPDEWHINFGETAADELPPCRGLAPSGTQEKIIKISFVMVAQLAIKDGVETSTGWEILLIILSQPNQKLKICSLFFVRRERP